MPRQRTCVDRGEPPWPMHFKNLEEGQFCFASAFRKILPKIEPTDLILTCPMTVLAAMELDGKRPASTGHVVPRIVIEGLEMEEELLDGSTLD